MKLASNQGHLHAQLIYAFLLSTGMVWDDQIIVTWHRYEELIVENNHDCITK
jgi:hypothetical protein